MSLPDKVKQLSNPMLVLHIFSKFIFGVGLGVVLSEYLQTAGWWIVGAGVVLSLIPCQVMFCKKNNGCCCCCSKEDS